MSAFPREFKNLVPVDPTNANRYEVLDETGNPTGQYTHLRYAPGALQVPDPTAINKQWMQPIEDELATIGENLSNAFPKIGDIVISSRLSVDPELIPTDGRQLESAYYPELLEAIGDSFGGTNWVNASNNVIPSNIWAYSQSLKLHVTLSYNISPSIGAYLYTSTDGLSWVDQGRVASGFVPVAIARSDALGLFLAVGYNSGATNVPERYVSSNGLAWTKVSSGATDAYQHRFVESMGSKFVVISSQLGYMDKVTYTTDGTTLSATSGFSSFYAGAIKYAPEINRCMIAGRNVNYFNPSTGGIIYSSNDGVTWVQSFNFSLPQSYAYGAFAYSPAVDLVIYLDNSEAAVYYSQNGEIWTRIVPVDAPRISSPPRFGWDDVAHHFICTEYGLTSTSKRTWISNDGYLWTLINDITVAAWSSETRPIIDPIKGFLLALGTGIFQFARAVKFAIPTYNPTPLKSYIKARRG